MKEGEVQTGMTVDPERTCSLFMLAYNLSRHLRARPDELVQNSESP